MHTDPLPITAQYKGRDQTASVPISPSNLMINASMGSKTPKLITKYKAGNSTESASRGINPLTSIWGHPPMTGNFGGSQA